MWKKKKKNVIYLISGILVIIAIGIIAYFAWPRNKPVESKETNSKQLIQQLQTELSSLKSKINSLLDTNQKIWLGDKLSDLESQIKKLANKDNSFSIKNIEQEIKEVKKKLENGSNNKNGGEFLYFDFSGGNYLFENVLSVHQKQIVIKISENHPRIKELVNQGKLQENKKFIIHYGKVDKKSGTKRDSFIFNEFNQELEITEAET